MDVAKYADLALATLGAAGAIYFLDTLEIAFNVKLYAPPLAASSIIIFSGIKPAPAVNVFGGSIGAASFALALWELGGGSPTTRAIAVGGSLVFFKTTGALFPPAAALATVFLDSPALQEAGWTYLLFPCLSGQLILYALAIGLSQARQKVRIAITRSQLDFSDVTVEEFRSLFQLFDTSGDGMIDATELQVALRKVINTDLDLSDCQQMVREADVNGNGAIDFDEFLQLLKFNPLCNPDGSSLSAYETLNKEE